MRAVWRFLKKLGRELPCDPAILLLGIYLEKTIIWGDECTPLFIAACLWWSGHGSSLGVHQWRRCRVYVQWSIAQPSKGEICHLQQHGWT